ncbi:hypothetical protein HAX54_012882 [Datura stramonium]|uniref:KIB1-4 beta-propeller domain-containing protein n=1 Tax=Datura stramonium TaxID=4076 RepID=A0ABS8RXS1_DATST|nr:hypothetical protein [Datura stramonium]
MDDQSWLKLDNLDRTIFAGTNCCMSVNASQLGCRSNCVYFTEHATDTWRLYEMGIALFRCFDDYGSETKSPVWEEPIEENKFLGTIRAGVLTPWTSYAASPHGVVKGSPTELSVGVIGVELNKRFAFLVPDGGVQRRNGYEESIYTLPYDVEDDPGLPEDDYEESVYTPPSNVDRYWRGRRLRMFLVSCNVIFNVLNLEMMPGFEVEFGNGMGHIA